MFIILKIVTTAHTVLKIGEYSQILPSWGIFRHVMCFRPIAHKQKYLMDCNKSRIFPSFSWETFNHTTCLDQSRASKNNRWIIRSNINHNF